MESQLNLLVIDDEEIDRMTIRREIAKSSLKAEIKEADSSAEAFSLIQDNLFDCIFLDYDLPDADGLSVLKKLHKRQVDAPVIMVTGQGNEQIAVELMKAGATDYIMKSAISAEKIERTLRNSLRIYQAEKAAAIATKKMVESNENLRRTNRLLNQKTKQLEEQQKKIESQNKKLKELSQLKSQFLANMSHEMRTPMNAIMGFSQMLLRNYPEPITQKQEDLVSRIFNNSKHLLNMLNEVLDFSKIESGNTKLNAEKFDVGDLVTNTVEELRSLAVKKNLPLKIDLDTEATKIVNDREYLRRVLINLIGNAIKFTDEGQVSVKMAEIDSEKLEIAVIDTGIGIAPEHLENIFEAFHQVDLTLSRKHCGTGLGLAISSKLVKAMGGKISVESKLGQGAIFRVQLPCYASILNSKKKDNKNKIEKS